MADWDIRPSDPLPEDDIPVRETPVEAVLRRSRRAVKILRVVAMAAVAIALIAQFGLTYMVGDERYGFSADTPGDYKFYNFLQGLSFPLVWAGMVFAASVVVDILATRFAVEHDGTGGQAPRRVDAAGDLIVNAPARPLFSRDSAAAASPLIDDAIWQPPIPTD
jgi:hypothetical protein